MRQTSWIVMSLLSLGLTGCIVPNKTDKQRGVIVVQNGPVVRTALRTLPTDYGTRMILSSDFLFSHRSNRLREGYEPTLIKVYDTIIDHEPYNKILIRAYTNEQPDRFANEHLTQMQADRIGSYLWASGIPKEKTTIRGMGSKNPVSSNASTTGQADNRRLEILIVK